MKKRKTIAVIAANTFNEYVNEILKGISEQCSRLNYDTVVFHMSYNRNSDSLVQIGEENIFTLINSDVICGAVFLCGDFVGQGILSSIEQRLSQMKIPVVAIDGSTALGETMIAEDTELFEIMTDHFIDKHGCREIMCLTGLESSPQSHTRAEGYRKSLIKHGIPVRDDLIIFGDFWINSAHELAEKFISGLRKIPEAVVCANDSMAVELCNTLISAGIRVPEDVMISGYDGSKKAEDNAPSITTIFPQNYKLGASAVCRIHNLLSGETPELIKFPPFHFMFGQSCRCGENFPERVGRHQYYVENIQKYENYYNSSGMMETLLGAENFEDLLRRLESFTYIINGLEKFILCLNENWDNVEEKEDVFISSGYSEKMAVRMIHQNDNYVSCEIKYASHDILPDSLDEITAHPAAYFLLPVHFKERCFGYAVFRFKTIEAAVCSIYAKWCGSLAVALEFLRVRTKLIRMNQRISLSSIRDTLTGVFNRKGFKRYSENFFRKAKAEHRKLLIIVADLDMLKHINDNYGHIEGDNAIIVCGKVLSTCCKNNEICARIGGDEYAVVGCSDYTTRIIDGYLKYINDYFERYNATSGKKYKVGASIGYYCGIPDENVSFTDCFSIADRNMYENKFERKKCRTV
ncbi:MAG: GGDEF domain-containing protein [Ruminococcus sp.]